MKTGLFCQELNLYFIVWIFANVYSLYELFRSQSEIIKQNQEHLEELKQGWDYIGRLKDVSDVEWSTWKYFIKMSWIYFVSQFAISEVIRSTKASLLKYWYILSYFIYVIFNMGYKQLIILSAQPILFAFVTFFGGNKLCIWSISILLLVSYNSLKYKHFFWEFLDHENLNDEEVYLILFGVAWMKLRCISFCFDYLEKKEKVFKTENKKTVFGFQDIIDMFSYVFYLPMLFTGPVIIYEAFEKSFNNQSQKLLKRLKIFMLETLIFFTYTFILDLSFHYMYFYAMQSNIELIKKLSRLALCGGGLWMGLEFHMKYVVSYGTTSTFAKLDNVETPPTPRCIARIHVYSQMWRYFDVGLYRFLVKYIYKPCYSTVAKYTYLSHIINKLLSSFLTFVFIFMWHGTIWDIFLWSALNYLGITLEYFSKEISKTEKYKWFKKNVLCTDAMETRFIAILSAPLLALSAISNFHLFAGSEIGYLFFKCLMQSPLWTFMVIIALYCCCHASMALDDVPSGSYMKKLHID